MYVTIILRGIIVKSNIWRLGQNAIGIIRDVAHQAKIPFITKYSLLLKCFDT